MRYRDPRNRTSYVTNADLLPLLARDQKAGKLSNELAALLMRIAEKYSQSNNWRQYSFREDMVSSANLALSDAWRKFDLEKTDNAFSFFTTVCYYAFLKVLIDEKKHRDIRDELLLDVGFNPSFGYKGPSDQAFGASDMHFEYDR